MNKRTGMVTFFSRVAGIAGCMLMCAVGPLAAQDTAAAMLNNDGVSVHTYALENFKVQNADARSVFAQLSKFSGVDIVLSENVEGIVSLTLREKTWKEILLIVCRTLNCVPIQEEGYVFVMTKEEFQEQRLTDVVVDQTYQENAPLSRRVITLNNISAKEMSTSIQPLLSRRGKITIVERNNAIIVFDIEENIEHIEQMIEQLDIETPQISISTKIIEVSSGTMQNIGVKWGYFDRPDFTGAPTDVSASHIQSENAIAGAVEKLTYGIIGQDRFALTLEYLLQNNEAEVVAQPQITTVVNKEATVFMGSQIPVTYFDDAGNTNVQFIDAGTELTVTPHVTSEDRIMLELHPRKESHQFRGNLPVIAEQSAHTNVVVNDGETVVIAGLTSNEMREIETGVPILKDIPLIGNLFKQTQKSLDKRDLIIFVTPHIIRRDLRNASTD